MSVLLLSLVPFSFASCFGFYASFPFDSAAIKRVNEKNAFFDFNWRRRRYYSEAVDLILVPTHLVILVDVKLKWQRNLLEFDIKLLDGLVEAGFIEYLSSPNAWHQANILRSLMSSNNRWADLILSLLLILTVLMCNVQTIYCFRLKFLNFLL